MKKKSLPEILRVLSKDKQITLPDASTLKYCVYLKLRGKKRESEREQTVLRYT